MAVNGAKKWELARSHYVQESVLSYLFHRQDKPDRPDRPDRPVNQTDHLSRRAPRNGYAAAFEAYLLPEGSL